jgi:hypothetical protein
VKKSEVKKKARRKTGRMKRRYLGNLFSYEFCRNIALAKRE